MFEERNNCIKKSFEESFGIIFSINLTLIGRKFFPCLKINKNIEKNVEKIHSNFFHGHTLLKFNIYELMEGEEG